MVEEKALSVPYFPPPESGGDWRSLVPFNTTPTRAEIQKVLGVADLRWSDLRNAYQYSASTAPNTTLLVIRNGWVAFDWGSHDAYPVASVSKSLTALVLARLFDLSSAGQVPTAVGPDSAVAQYLPATWAAGNTSLGAIKIKDIMTMTSGLLPNDDPGQPNYLSVILSQPAIVAPEVQWAYASLPIDLLSIAMQTIAGKPVGDAFNQLIAGPVGISPITWQMNGVYSLASDGASISARELARIGYLMLMDGAWASGTGEGQVISAANAASLHQRGAFAAKAVFTATAGSPFPVQPDSPSYYGHLWWTNRTQSGPGTAVPGDAYYAWGYRETFLIVIPSLDMVVVRYGYPPYAQAGYGKELMARIMAAVVAR